MTGNPQFGPPRVSVLLTTFNGAEYISETIESILAQTYQQWELVVIDDGSTDGTGDIVRSFGDDRIRVYEQENRGRGAALNRSLALARGEFVAIIDDDDIAAVNRLERQMSYLDEHNDVDVVGTGYLNQWQDKGKSDLEPVNPPISDSRIRRTLPFRNPIAHSSVMYRRQAVLSIGGYRETLKSCLDYDLWVRLVAAGYTLGNIGQTLVTIRKHRGQSFRFDGRAQLRHRIRMIITRFQAVTASELPYRYWLAPLVMLVWALVPESARATFRRLLN